MKILKSILVFAFVLWSFVATDAYYQFDIKVASGIPLADREVLATSVYGLYGKDLTKTFPLPLETLVITKKAEGIYTFSIDQSIVSKFDKIIFDSPACVPSLSNQDLLALTLGYTNIAPICRCKDIRFNISLPQGYCTDWYVNRNDARQEMIQHFNLPDCNGACPINSSCEAVGLYADAGIGNADLVIEHEPGTGRVRFCVTPRGNQNWYGRIDCECTVIR